MSGHSKWATTKRQKAVVDAKRGALFTKIANQIAIAARGGTDPNMNPSLAMMLEKARQANMPKVNIERAIARVADSTLPTNRPDSGCMGGGVITPSLSRRWSPRPTRNPTGSVARRSASQITSPMLLFPKTIAPIPARKVGLGP